MNQDWRSFIGKLEEADSYEVMRIAEEISREYEVTAFMMELETKGFSPLVIFENVKGNSVPIVTNLLGSRKRIAFAFNVEVENLCSEYARRTESFIPEKLIKDCPAHFKVYTENELNITDFPVMTHFDADPAPYVTAGLIVSADPDTGKTSLGYHRLMVKGRNRLGISLHSRKRLWDYQRRAEEKGENLPIACLLGVHPLISLSSIGVFPNQIGKYEVSGGLLGEPLEVVEGINVPLKIPAYAEIVLEGEILANVRESEGPVWRVHRLFFSSQHTTRFCCSHLIPQGKSALSEYLCGFLGRAQHTSCDPT